LLKTSIRLSPRWFSKLFAQIVEATMLLLVMFIGTALAGILLAAGVSTC
jgi:hypothetical protein